MSPIDGPSNHRLFLDKYLNQMLPQAMVASLVQQLLDKGFAVTRIVPPATDQDTFTWQAVDFAEDASEPKHVRWVPYAREFTILSDEFDLSRKDARIYPRRKKRRLTYLRNRG